MEENKRRIVAEMKAELKQELEKELCPIVVKQALIELNASRAAAASMHKHVRKFAEDLYCINLDITKD